MRLQILIPQYNETESVISKLLDSIQIQQGINIADDVGVIIVNDGSNTLLSKEFLSKYDFPIEYHKDKHRGIAGTRNALLDYAKADYIMFCDADDMFCSAVAIYSIIRSIYSGGFEELISYFYAEGIVNGIYRYDENTRVIHPFIHGKVYNRHYLKDKNIRFNEEMTYHEDVYFSFIAHSCAQDVKLLQQYAYIWKHNNNSITHSPNFSIKHYTDSLKSIELTCDELIKRDKIQDAQFYFTCCMYNTYFFMHQESWLDQINGIYWKDICKALQKLWAKLGKSMFEEEDEERRKQIWDSTVDSSIAMLNVESKDDLEPFKPWLDRILEGNYDDEEEAE